MVGTSNKSVPEMAVFRYQSSGSTVSRNHGSWDPRWRQLAEYVLLIILVLIQIVDFGRRNWKVKRTGLYRKEIGNDRNFRDTWGFPLECYPLGSWIPRDQPQPPRSGHMAVVSCAKAAPFTRCDNSPEGRDTVLIIAGFIDVHRWWTIRLEVYDSPCDVIITWL